MRSDFKHLDQKALQVLFIQESKAFLTALEHGENWEQLEKRRVIIRELSALIVKQAKVRSGGFSSDPASAS